MLSVHLKISGHYPDGRSAWLKMGLPDGYQLNLTSQLSSFRPAASTGRPCRAAAYFSVSWTGSFGEGMKVLDSVTGFITRNKKRSFEELSDWMLAVLGVVAFLVAGYWGLMLGEAVPGFIKETNQTGISLPAVGLGLLLGGFGLSVWFFGCIAARCHALLYERWFK